MSIAVVLCQLTKQLRGSSRRVLPFSEQATWSAGQRQLSQKGAKRGIGIFPLAFGILVLYRRSCLSTGMDLYNELYFLTPQCSSSDQIANAAGSRCLDSLNNIPCSIKGSQVLTQQSCSVPRTINQLLRSLAWKGNQNGQQA